MATLDISTPGELRLILSGAAENAILNTLRHWPHWLSVEVEHDSTDPSQVLSVTLITSSGQEATIREILRRSFGLTFPAEGGERALKVAAAPEPSRRRSAARRD